MTPEQQARQHIDEMLLSAGWVLQHMKRFNPNEAVGVAVREFQTDQGPADYILFMDGEPVGVIEAKPAGTILSPVEEQSNRYASARLKWSVRTAPLFFIYESTGTETRFTDTRDPAPRSREIFHFHRPETFREWLREKRSLRDRLQDIPDLELVRNQRPNFFRECQYKAIRDLEKSFRDNRPRALIQMATGAGKTFTAINFTYRLLKYAGAKRILFLVDTRNLGEQAEQEFQAFTPPDDNRKFTELYNVQRLRSSRIDGAGQVCISTIQRMYSILRGEELDESAEEASLYESSNTGQRTKDVAYNPKVSIEAFDFIIIDECHRSIYNIWKQVLDYFDAFLIGLTATPDARTFAFFNKNVVSEYPYEQSVVDGVNVPYDVYSIETDITRNGALIQAGAWVDKRHRETRRKTWEMLDEDVEYRATQLDRDVVNPDQIRTVIRTFRERLTNEIFPGRSEVPKTLIFAKSDAHAEDIIGIVREEFNEGNRFCKKVTYAMREEKPSDVLQQFRNDYYPRIAVTVDMIATGTDVKAIECLLFMRDVKSRSYFEQMKGRGTRTLAGDELKKRSPSANGNKSRFVIVDAVGVCRSIKTDSRPLERQPGVSLKNLMLNVVMGQRDEDTLTSLAGRLTRLEKQLDAPERRRFAEIADGKSINQVVQNLLDAYNPDVVETAAMSSFATNYTPQPGPFVSLTASEAFKALPPAECEAQRQDARNRLAKNAASPFSNPDLRDFIENVRRRHEQVIDTVNIDTVLSAAWDGTAEDRARQLTEDFKTWLEENKDRVDALRIWYNTPQRRRDITLQHLREMLRILQEERPLLAPLGVWDAYAHLDHIQPGKPLSELTALVALLRRVTEMDQTLTPYDQTVRRNFQTWVMQKQAGALKFTPEQTQWLQMLRDHIATSLHVSAEDLDLTPFHENGGRGRMFQLFGNGWREILEEMNAEVAA
jgi:type I restriction enzyme, R subunit